jgi:periplasmic divalent cation tolerance protein
MPEPVVVLVTCSDADEAERIASCLVEERLAACANVAGPIQSVFRWKGALEKATEYLLLIKTHRELFEKIAARVEELHSYEVPEIVALPIVAGSRPYLDWINDALSGA